jgi:transcriptional regulator with XRE-family HTH domain
MSKLRKLRRKKGYSQVQVQLLTGIDQSNYSKLEKGCRYLTFEQCKRLAVVLDTSMDYLAELTDEERPYPRKQ